MLKIFLNKTFINSIVYTVLPKLSIVLSILILPLISPYLSLKDYGIYGLIMSILGLFQILIILGQNVVIQNSFFTHNNKYRLVWRRSFGLMIYMSLLMSFLLFLPLYFIIYPKSQNNFLSIYICCVIFLIFSSFDTIFSTYFILKQKAFSYSIGVCISSALYTLSVLILIKYYKIGYLGWIYSFPIIGIVNYIYFFKTIFLKEKIIPIFLLKRNFITKSLKIGAPLTPHQFSLYLLSISDRILLNYFNVPIVNIGFYTQGYNVGSQGISIVNGIFQSYSVKLQNAFRNDSFDNNQFIRNTMIFIPILISLILFLISIWMKESFQILFRNIELRQSFTIAIVVICSFMYWSTYTFFTYPLSIFGDTLSISKITIIAALSNLTLNIIFIPKYGVNAALVVTYISYVIFGIAGFYNKKNFLFLTKFLNIKKAFLLEILFFGFLTFLALYIKDFNILSKTIITLITISSILLVLKYKNTFS